MDEKSNHEEQLDTSNSTNFEIASSIKTKSKAEQKCLSLSPSLWTWGLHTLLTMDHVIVATQPSS